MNPKLFDIHSHINFNAFKKDGDEVIKKTLEESVWTVLVGSQYDTSKRALEYAEKYEKGIYTAIALHPFHIIEQEIEATDWELSKENLNDSNSAPRFKTRPEKFDAEKYAKLAKSPKVVAIGECGLDYYHIPENFNISEVKNLQIEAFEQQIELALKLNLPVMIHCREAHDEVIKILKKYKSRAGDKLRGDIHFFTGNLEQSKQYFNLDFSISFTGVITFVSNYDEVIKKSPLERIMIETDAPYVAPAPYRGKRNEPIYVKEVVRRIAEIKNISFEEAAEATTENAIEMFLKTKNFS